MVVAQPPLAEDLERMLLLGAPQLLAPQFCTNRRRHTGRRSLRLPAPYQRLCYDRDTQDLQSHQRAYKGVDTGHAGRVENQSGHMVTGRGGRRREIGNPILVLRKYTMSGGCKLSQPFTLRLVGKPQFVTGSTSPLYYTSSCTSGAHARSP